MGAKPSSAHPYVYEDNLTPVARKKLALLLIDPQNDFVAKTGSLSVPGAEDDAARLCAQLARNIDAVDDIFVTLDTHAKFHIAHADFWVNKEGQKPAPFTEITVQDVETGKWQTSKKEFAAHALAYVRELAVDNKFTLMVWPDHCLIGGTGHAVYGPLFDDLLKWEAHHKRPVRYVLKGHNSKTEMYSAFRAEIPEAKDPMTRLNVAFIKDLMQFDRIIVSGQASSHCVNYSVRDLIEKWPPNRLGDIWIAKDTMSSVQGADAVAERFFVDMAKAGCTISTVAEAFAGAKSV